VILRRRSHPDCRYFYYKGKLCRDRLGQGTAPLERGLLNRDVNAITKDRTVMYFLQGNGSKAENSNGAEQSLQPDVSD